MAQLSSGMMERKLDSLFEMVTTNELALPELQRASVWGNSMVPRLISSVYEDYPFGILLFWTPKTGGGIRCRPFAFQRGKDFDTTDTAEHYLIDGQQRLTSFYKALHPDGDLSVAFNLKTEEFALPDGRIQQMLVKPEEHGWYDLRHLLSLKMQDMVELVQRHAELGEEYLNNIFDNKLRRLRPESIPITIYNIEHKTYADVAEIFERINLGKPVKRSQILLGKLSAVYPGIVSEVEDYLARMRDQHGSGFDLDLFISTFSTIATGYADVDRFEHRYLQDKPSVGQVQTDLKHTFDTLFAALGFIEKYLYIDTFKYFTSERTLVALAYLHHRFPKEMLDDAYSQKIARWAYSCVLAGHHQDFGRLRKDLALMRWLEDDESPEIMPQKLMTNFGACGSSFDWRIRTLTDMDSAISRNNLLFGIMYGLARWKGAKSFMSHEPICTSIVDDSEDDEDVVDEKTVNELAIHEHHIYPRSQLVKEAAEGDTKLSKEWIFDLANFTFLTGKDNIELKDPPITYLRAYSKELKDPHMIRSSQYGPGQYWKFLKDRRKLIRTRLDEFLAYLEAQASVDGPARYLPDNDGTKRPL